MEFGIISAILAAAALGADEGLGRDLTQGERVLLRGGLPAMRGKDKPQQEKYCRRGGNQNSDDLFPVFHNVLREIKSVLNQYKSTVNPLMRFYQFVGSISTQKIRKKPEKSEKRICRHGRYKIDIKGKINYNTKVKE